MTWFWRMSLLSILYWLNGCGTVMGYREVYTKSEQYDIVPYYAGTIVDWYLLFTMFFPIGIIDLPLSLVADTLLLPVIFLLNW